MLRITGHEGTLPEAPTAIHLRASIVRKSHYIQGLRRRGQRLARMWCVLYDPDIRSMKLISWGWTHGLPAVACVVEKGSQAQDAGSMPVQRGRANVISRLLFRRDPRKS